MFALKRYNFPLSHDKYSPNNFLELCTKYVLNFECISMKKCHLGMIIIIKSLYSSHTIENDELVRIAAMVQAILGLSISVIPMSLSRYYVPA